MLEELRLKEQKLQKIQRARLRSIDVFKTLEYVPTARQQEFHSATEYDVFYGGALGGGKTLALLMEGLRTCVRYPGIRVGAFRRTYPELKESLIKELAERGYAQSLGAKWAGSEYELRFPNGSVFMFRYAENMTDASRRLGAEFQLMIFDERTQTPPDVLTFLESRIRSGNPEVPVIGIRSACVDEGEVLTATGWKPIQDVQVGECVQSVDPAGRMSLKPVDWTFAGPATQGLVRVDKRTLFMSMTPDHRVVHQRPTSTEHKITPWNEIEGKSVRIVRAAREYSAPGFFNAPFGWKPEDYLAFLGLFLAEGCTSGTVRNGNYKTVVTQCTEGNQQPIKDLLDRLTLDGEPIKWNLSKNGDFQITRKVVWEHFRQFGKAYDKHIPREVLLTADPAQLRILFDWLVFGDGSVRSDKAVSYHTTSPQLADDFAELALKLCYKVQTAVQELPSPAHRARYVVYCNGEGNATLIEDGRFRQEVFTVPYDGDVYCIKVRGNENFFLRQRGKVWLSGNSNPGGPSHSAAKTRYIEPTDYGQKVVTDIRDRSVRFIPSKVSDNPHLNEEYRKDLLGLPEQLRKAYLEGNWDVFEGQMFPELSYDRHIVEPQELPNTWRRYIGVDWGFTAPWAVLWGAVDPDGRLWIYREIYQKGVGEKEQARRILEAEQRDEHISGRFADDQMWAVMGDAKPIAQVYAENGVPLDRAGKGPGSRVNGWQRIHSFLAEDAPCQFHAAMGWGSCPRIHFFKQCMHVFKELTDLPHARIGNPEDSDPKAPDHACDALRYMAVNLGNDSRFHWPEEQRVEVVLDPKMEGPVTPPYGYNTIGGFPILGPSGNPWEL